jgi:hypothetical protein
MRCAQAQKAKGNEGSGKVSQVKLPLFLSSYMTKGGTTCTATTNLLPWKPLAVSKQGPERSVGESMSACAG